MLKSNIKVNEVPSANLPLIMDWSNAAWSWGLVHITSEFHKITSFSSIFSYAIFYCFKDSKDSHFSILSLQKTCLYER